VGLSRPAALEELRRLHAREREAHLNRDAGPMPSLCHQRWGLATLASPKRPG
jgi:hypothetical protein